MAGGGAETLLLLSPLDRGRLEQEQDIIVTISKDKSLLESFVAVKYKLLFN